MNLRQRFGKRLKELRLRQSLTQVELAEKISASASFISAIERGIDAPSFETLEALSEALNIEIFEFFYFTEDRK